MIGIIPCAGKGTRFYELGKNYPKCTLPYKEKPLIFHSVLWMQKQGCKKIYIIADHKKEKIQKIVNEYNLEAKIISPIDASGLSTSVYSALIKEPESSVLILLGDLIVNSDIEKKSNNWVSTFTVDDWSRWCMFDPLENKFYEKPEVKPSTNQALSGVYYITESSSLQQAIEEQFNQKIQVKGEYTLSSAFEIMKQKFDYQNLDIIDFGTIEKFFANKQIKKERSFNKVTFNGPVVTKSSSQRQKILNEINWYKNIPFFLKSKTPKIFDWNVFGDEAYYSMHKIDKPSLRELFLFFDRDIELWKKILSTCVNVYKSMIAYKYDYSSFDFIFNKTKERSRGFEVSNFLDEFKKTGQALDTSTHLIHGDFIPSNLFWDEINQDIILIDPRGEMFGSKYYDWAKLKHSFNYYYDFIDSGLYSLRNGKLSILNEGCEEIENMFNSFEEDIFDKEERRYLKLLTASLFLSEIPLHYHSKPNQKAYFKIFEEISRNIII